MAATTPAVSDESNSKGSTSGIGSKLVLGLSAINLLATIGMFSIIFINFQKDKQKPSIEDLALHSSSEGDVEKSKEHGAEGKNEESTGHSAKDVFLRKTFNFGKMVTLDQFTVNLSTLGSVGAKYVRVNVSLEVPNEDIETEIGSKMPQVRNSIIDIFNSKRASDLASADGRDYLKDEIKEALNSFLVTGKVKGVFFTSFAIAG